MTDVMVASRTVKSECPYTENIGEVMSNFDRVIESEIAERLKVEEVWAGYAGWNFHGRVWWARDHEHPLWGRWRCEVWCYGHPVTVVEGDELRDIMEEVSDRWGAD